MEERREMLSHKLGLKASAQRESYLHLLSIAKPVRQPSLLQWGKEIEFSHKEEQHMFWTIVPNLPYTQDMWTEFSLTSLFNSILQTLQTWRRGEVGCDGDGVGEKYTSCASRERPSLSANLPALHQGGTRKASVLDFSFLIDKDSSSSLGHGWEESLAILKGSKNSNSDFKPCQLWG